MAILCKTPIKPTPEQFGLTQSDVSFYEDVQQKVLALNKKVRISVRTIGMLIPFSIVIWLFFYLNFGFVKILLLVSFPLCMYFGFLLSNKLLPSILSFLLGIKSEGNFSVSYKKKPSKELSEAIALANVIKQEYENYKVSVTTWQEMEWKRIQFEKRQAEERKRLKLEEERKRYEPFAVSPSKVVKEKISSNEYDKYLRTGAWRMKREWVLSIRGNKCEVEGCGSFTNLQVHHITYDRLFHERISDFRVLCTSCHHKVHELFDLQGRYIGWL